MITDTVQRWTERRESRRPAGELIRPSAYDVVESADDTTPRAFVERHHYSGSWVAARFRFLLYQRGELAGVAVFSVPASGAAHRAVWPTLEPDEAVDLGRFVLEDSVPGNGESWFIARCFELLVGRVVGIASCADPVARETIRQLDAGRLAVVAGGLPTGKPTVDNTNCTSCISMSSCPVC